MAKTTDDLEAVRIVTTALGGFSPEDQERIIRWAREKLGLAPATRNLPETRLPQPSSSGARQAPAEPSDPLQSPASSKDLKTFVVGKSPKSDVQFAAAVAYFYRFEAAPEKRKNEIDSVILQDACRLAGRQRFNNPLMTLNNAKRQGLVDSGSEAGKFAINTVGENLVAMTLPGQSENPARGKKHMRPKKLAKKNAKKNAKKKK